jgi:hypothetical protein
VADESDNNGRFAIPLLHQPSFTSTMWSSLPVGINRHSKGGTTLGLLVSVLTQQRCVKSAVWNRT